jgi:regulatory protein
MEDSERCYATSLRILRYRWNSAGELERKLRAKGFDRETIESTLRRLAEEKWLDDQRFAGGYVRARLQKRIGRNRLRRELFRAGVSNEVIEKAVAENVDSEGERARAVAVAEKRLPILIKRYGAEGARNKLTAYLLNQGYDGSLVYETVRNVLKK